MEIFMKNVKVAKNTYLLVTLLVLSSCGNPHLVKNETLSLTSQNTAADLKVVPVKENTLIESELTVANKEGDPLLSFGLLPSNIEVTKTLVVKNNSNSELPLNFKFQSGNAYFFSGGSYPGLHGTCTDKLKAKEQCTLEITFRSNELGLFEDTLSLISLNNINFTIPLTGERKSADGDSTSSLIVQGSALGTTIDFGSAAKGSIIHKEIEINNTLEKNIVISEILLNDEDAFKIVDLGDCTKIVKPGSCKLNLSFKPNDLKSFKSDLVIKDENQSRLVIKLSGVGVIKQACTNITEIMQRPSLHRSVAPSGIVFPYLFSSPSTSSRLNLLYGSDFNVHVKGVSLKTVKDAQVLIEYKLPKGDFSHLSDIKVDLDIWKIINDDYKDTEMICLTSKNFKRCSGRIYTLDSWKKLLNPHFWNKGGVISNTLFEDKLAKTEAKCGEKNCEVLREVISFKELFNLSEEDLKKLASESVFHLVLADDSRSLNFPKLLLKSEMAVKCEDK